MKKLIVLSLAAMVFAGCTLQIPQLLPQTPPKQPEQQVSQTSSPSPVATPSATVKIDKTIEVSASNFTYDKKEIRVKKDENIVIKFTNGEGFHDFVVDELNVRTQRIPESESETVRIPTDKAGTYAYYCSVGNHRAQGMEGKLIIE